MSFPKKTLCLLLCFALSGQMLAQINESDTLAFQLQLGLSGLYQQGNVDFLSLRAKVDASSKLNKYIIFKTQNNTLYQAFSGFKADEDYSSRNFVYYKPQNKFYPLVMGFVSTNFRRKIDLLYFVGVGLTWQIIKTKEHTLKTSLALVYEQAVFRQAIFNIEKYNGSNRIENWRAAAYLAGKHALAPSLSFFYEAYLQPSLQTEDNYRLFFDAGFNWQIKPRLAAQLLYWHTFERVVVQNIKSTDTILTFGINYSLRK